LVRDPGNDPERVAAGPVDSASARESGLCEASTAEKSSVALSARECAPDPEATPAACATPESFASGKIQEIASPKLTLTRVTTAASNAPTESATIGSDAADPATHLHDEPANQEGGKAPSRARDFQDHLSHLRIGSLPETRSRFFDAVEEVLKAQESTTPLRLIDLLTRAGSIAQQTADRDGYHAEKNWAVAAKCNFRLMLKEGVLKGSDGAPLLEKIGFNAMHVVDIAPDFRQRCEGYLALRIIEGTDGLNFDDDPHHLGLTLFRRGREKPISYDELRAMADAVLLSLEEAGKIEKEGDRIVLANLQAPRLAMVKK
jgi:hypothetical protein